MSAQIIALPNAVSPTINPFCVFPLQAENGGHQEKSSEFENEGSDKEYKNFDEIRTDEEMGREMFPPDYFMLVE